MTISTTESKISYNGNGTTTVFAFPYRFLANGDLVVIRVAANGTETTLVLNTDYTITGADSDDGGSITCTVAPASGTRLVIYRSVALTQETDYISGDAFPAETHERALDRLTMISQQLQEGLDRSAKLPVTSTADADALVADLIRLADSADNIDTVADDITNINAVASDLLEPVSEINTVAVDIANVNAVGTNIANVNTVAGISGNVTTVAGISANVTTVAGIAADVTTVAGIAADVAAVENIAANVTTVANISSNVTTVAGISANVTTVAGISADVTTVATNIADVQNAEENATAAINAKTAAESARDATLAALDSFDDRYLGQKASDPTLDNDGNALAIGALYFNTTTGIMKVYDGSAWLAAYASLSGALLTTNNLSDLTNTATARSNLGVAIGTDVQAYDADLADLASVGAGTGNNQYVKRNATGGIPVNGTWTVYESAGVLYFAVGGVAKAKLDGSGNLTVVGNVTAYGTM